MSVVTSQGWPQNVPFVTTSPANQINPSQTQIYVLTQYNSIATYNVAANGNTLCVRHWGRDSLGGLGAQQAQSMHK